MTEKEKIKQIDGLLKKYNCPDYYHLRLGGLEKTIITIAFCLLMEKRGIGEGKREVKFPNLQLCPQCGGMAGFAYYTPEKKVSVRCLNGKCGMATPVCKGRLEAWVIWNGLLGLVGEKDKNNS